MLLYTALQCNMCVLVVLINIYALYNVSVNMYVRIPFIHVAVVPSKLSILSFLPPNILIIYPVSL